MLYSRKDIQIALLEIQYEREMERYRAEQALMKELTKKKDRVSPWVDSPLDKALKKAWQPVARFLQWMNA